MKKSILNIGQALKKVDLLEIQGGGKPLCNTDEDCCGVGNLAYQYICNGIVCIIGIPAEPCSF